VEPPPRPAPKPPPPNPVDGEVVPAGLPNAGVAAAPKAGAAAAPNAGVEVPPNPVEAPMPNPPPIPPKLFGTELVAPKAGFPNPVDGEPKVLVAGAAPNIEPPEERQSTTISRKIRPFKLTSTKVLLIPNPPVFVGAPNAPVAGLLAPKPKVFVAPVFAAPNPNPPPAG